MISWYYWDSNQIKQKKHIIRSYKTNYQNYKHCLPAKFSKSQNKPIRPENSSDMRLLYKDYVKNTNTSLSPQLKKTEMLCDYMALQKFFNILQGQKLKLDLKRQNNKKFVYNEQKGRRIFRFLKNKATKKQTQQRICVVHAQSSCSPVNKLNQRLQENINSEYNFKTQKLIRSIQTAKSINLNPLVTSFSNKKTNKIIPKSNKVIIHFQNQ